VISAYNFELAERILPAMRVVERNHVRVLGRGAQPMLFAHGFGCDQNMWRLIHPAFQADYRVILFDYVGHGSSDRSAYDPTRYGSLAGYAEDVIDICDELELQDVVFVGHSVSAMIGAIASLRRPELFASLVFVGPSPCYVDDATTGYIGGFSSRNIAELLDSLDDNYLGWSRAMAPAIMSNPERPELGEELTNSFCRTDPQIAKQFARVTFLSDHRADLPLIRTPSLILQCAVDVIAPVSVGEYMQRAMPASELVVLEAHGHCPQLSEPEATIAAMEKFLAARRAQTPAPPRG
jgi:sigma-B regulation protein RsbQ